jgi:hypothetical protein
MLESSAARRAADYISDAVICERAGLAHHRAKRASFSEITTIEQ